MFNTITSLRTSSIPAFEVLVPVMWVLLLSLSSREVNKVLPSNEDNFGQASRDFTLTLARDSKATFEMYAELY